MGPFASFRIRNFRFLITGTTLTSTANWIQQVIMNWLAYDLTGSGTILGSINLARSLAMLCLIPAAGLMIDRLNHRRLMMLVGGWLCFISTVMGMLLIFGPARVPYLFIFSFLAGVAISVDSSLRQVMIFNLVPRALTPNALALVQTGWSITRSFGPAIGGFLVLWFGAGGNFLVQAVAYGLIILSISRIQYPKQESALIGRSPLQNIREGIVYVAGQPVTRAFMLMGLILPSFIIPIFAVMPPIYTKDIFQGGPEMLGYLLSAIGVGGIIGGVVTASLGRFERRGLLQISAIILASLALTGFAMSTTLWTALPLLTLAGFSEVIFLTTNQTLLQLSIPDNMRGRVTSIVNLNAAISPFGCLLAGLGTDFLGGARITTMLMCGTAACIAICILIFSRTIRNYRLSQAIAERSDELTAGLRR